MMEELKKSREVNQKKLQLARIFPFLKSASKVWLELSFLILLFQSTTTACSKKLKNRGKLMHVLFFYSLMFENKAMQTLHSKKYNHDMVHSLSILF